MHELAITKALLALVEKECTVQHIHNPKKIIVELGSLQSYAKDSLLFYFAFLKKENDLLASSELEVREVQAKVACNACHGFSKVTQPYLLFCEHCESTDVEIVEGKDFILKEITQE